MKYAWIFLFRAAWPITLICEVLNVSVSGYFEHQRRRAQERPSGPGGRHGNEELLAHIRAIHAEVKGEYGWPRVWKELLARGIRVGKDRVQRLMQAHGIKARGKRKFVVTTDSKHSLPVAENLLARDFHPSAPDRVWSSDITYIATDEGWLYLACVIDLFSGWLRPWGWLKRTSRLRSAAEELGVSCSREPSTAQEQTIWAKAPFQARRGRCLAVRRRGNTLWAGIAGSPAIQWVPARQVLTSGALGLVEGTR